MRRRDKCALLAATLLGAACGPIEYVANTPLEAAPAVAEADHVKAEKYAPYEITAAREYLHKSRELAGFARFHASVEFARKATKLAKDARNLSVEKAALPEPDAGPKTETIKQESSSSSSTTTTEPARTITVTPDSSGGAK